MCDLCSSFAGKDDASFLLSLCEDEVRCAAYCAVDSCDGLLQQCSHIDGAIFLLLHAANRF